MKHELPKDINCETVDEWCNKLPDVIHHLYLKRADAIYEVYLAKRECEETETNAAKRLYNIKHKGKEPSASWVNHALQVDAYVMKAHLSLADKERAKNKIDASIKKVESIDQKLIAFKTERNNLMKRM